jgi:hypothetical protein
MAPGMSLLSINAVLILNTEDGSRIYAKYYSTPHQTATTAHGQGSGRASKNLKRYNCYSGVWASHANSLPVIASTATASSPYADLKSQKAFEKGLAEKTLKMTGDIILYDNRIVLYKMESDVMMYVVGSLDENEVLLYNVILALRDSLHLLFKYVLPTFHVPRSGGNQPTLFIGNPWTSAQYSRITTLFPWLWMRLSTMASFSRQTLQLLFSE